MRSGKSIQSLPFIKSSQQQQQYHQYQYRITESHNHNHRKQYKSNNNHNNNNNNPKYNYQSLVELQQQQEQDYTNTNSNMCTVDEEGMVPTIMKSEHPPLTTTTAISTDPNTNDNHNNNNNTTTEIELEMKEMSHNTNHTTTSTSITKNSLLQWKVRFLQCMDIMKYTFSILLLLFSIFIVMYIISTNQTVVTNDNNIHSSIAIIIYWFLIVWLAIMEGGQNAIVGLQSIHSKLYQKSHPRTYKCTTFIYGTNSSDNSDNDNNDCSDNDNDSSNDITSKGNITNNNTTTNNKLERFIIGRQFLVVLVVFLLNTISTPINNVTILKNNNSTDTNDTDIDTDTSNSSNNTIPNILITIFVYNNIATILITIIFGQLIAQINSSYYMLDFLNNYFILLIEYISIYIIELSGLLHSVYLIQILFNYHSNHNNKQKKKNDTLTTTNSSTAAIDINNNNELNHTNNNNNINNNKKLVQSETDTTIQMMESSNNNHDLTPNNTTTNTSPNTTTTTTMKTKIIQFFFWLRILFSICIVIFGFTIIFYTLIHHQTKMWDNIPIILSIILLLIFMIIIGLLEGIQIALFKIKYNIQNNTNTFQIKHPMVYKNCYIVFNPLQPQNLSAFLIGRQICVTCCTFIVARITSINADLFNTTTNDTMNSNTIETTTENIFHFNDTIQNFLNTGLLGAIITTIFGSLIWRIIASSFPIVFLSNPIIYICIRTCLYIEQSGICSSAWILAYIHEKCMNYKSDTIYIDTIINNNNNNDNDTMCNQTPILLIQRESYRSLNYHHNHDENDNDHTNNDHDLDLEENIIIHTNHNHNTDNHDNDTK